MLIPNRAVQISLKAPDKWRAPCPCTSKRTKRPLKGVYGNHIPYSDYSRIWYIRPHFSGTFGPEGQHDPCIYEGSHQKRTTSSCDEGGTKAWTLARPRKPRSL